MTAVEDRKGAATQLAQMCLKINQGTAVKSPQNLTKGTYPGVAGKNMPTLRPDLVAVSASNLKSTLIDRLPHRHVRAVQGLRAVLPIAQSSDRRPLVERRHHPFDAARRPVYRSERRPERVAHAIQVAQVVGVHAEQGLDRGHMP